MFRRGLVIIASIVVLAGCGSGGVVATPDKSEAVASSAKPAAAKVGQPVTIKGNVDGVQAQISVVKVVPTTKGGQFDTPTAGNRYAAVQFRIKNTGTVAYEDSPMNGAKVIDSEGQQFTAALVTETKAGPMLPASVKLTPGGAALGYLVFEVPKAAKLTGVQFGMDSGFGQTAEWVIAAK